MNFVDDSSNIVYTKDIQNLGEYINKFYILLEAIYSINKLAINSDKTELMIICKNKYRKDTKHIVMQASNFIVNQVKKVKILGYTIQSNLKNNAQIGNILSNLNNRIYNIKKLGNKTFSEIMRNYSKIYTNRGN